MIQMTLDEFYAWFDATVPTKDQFYAKWHELGAVEGGQLTPYCIYEAHCAAQHFGIDDFIASLRIPLVRKISYDLFELSVTAAFDPEKYLRPAA